MATQDELNGDRCPKCNGTGIMISGVFEVDCDNCLGTGVINSPTACKLCNGSGKLVLTEDGGHYGVEVMCDRCFGSGLEPKE